MTSYKALQSFILFSLILIFMISMTSAILPTKTITPSVAKDQVAKLYPAIEIDDWLGLGKKLWSGQIEEHTATCGINCYTEISVYSSGDNPLVDEVKFYTLVDSERIEQPIRSFQFYIQTEVKEIEIEDYEYQCEVIGKNINGSDITECANVKVGVHTELTPEWTPYTIGDIVLKGNYILKLEGEKRPDRTVDWVIETQGKVLDEWATWGSMGNISTTGLKAYYSFDEVSGNALDSSPLSNNATNFGTTPRVEGILGNAVNLSASDRFLQSINNIDIDNTMDYTIAFWLYEDNNSETQGYVTMNDQDAHMNLAGVYRYNKNGVGGTSSTNNINQSAWDFFTITASVSSGDVKLYVNKNLAFTCTSCRGALGNGKLTIGRQVSSSGSEFVRGYIDELGIWNRILTSAEINSTYSYATTSSITLNSPADGYISPTNQVTFNATANIIGGATLTNMSLLLDGIVNQTKILGTENINDANATDTSTGATNLGIEIMPITDVTLTGLKRMASSTSSTYKVGTTSGGTEICTGSWGTGTVTGLNCPLSKNTIYYITSDSGGASRNARYKTVTYPFIHNLVNVTQGATALGVDTTKYWEIESFNVSASSTQTFTSILTTAENWSIQACDSDGNCGFSENRTVSVDTLAPQISLLYPIGIIPLANVGQNISLNYSIIDAQNNLQSCWYNYNLTTNVTIPCTANASLILGTQKSITMYANDSVGNLNTSIFNWSYTYFIYNETYNNSTYETSQETYTINATGMTTATLVYNGTEYPATVSNELASYTLSDVPEIASNTIKNFYWKINGGVVNSSVKQQYVNNISLSVCGGPGGNNAFINFTYKDETSGLNINATNDLASWTYYLGSGAVTKTYLFTNTTSNPSTSFCFSNNRTLHTILIYQYSGSGYPQRYYTKTSDLTNSTTNQVLYLLGSADGIYTTISIQNAVGNSPISGVTVTAERSFSGILTMVGQGTSDSAGAVTFWVNPNYDHTFTASKTGYQTQILTVRPTQTTYTLMFGTTSNTYQNYTWQGIEWFNLPKSGELNKNTSYIFSFNVSASLGNLVKCKFELQNSSFSIINSVEGSAYNSGQNCIATASINTGTTNDRLFGYYYLDLGSGYALLKANDAWILTLGNQTSYNFFDTLKGLNDLPDFGSTHNRREFSKIVVFFFLLSLVMGAFCYFTGYDFAQPGAGLLLLWVSITLGSFAGIFNIEGISRYNWFNKYSIMLITSFITWGFLLDTWRRNSQ